MTDETTQEDGASDVGEEPSSPAKKRSYIPLVNKIDLCMKAERVVRTEQLVSLKAFCRDNNIQPSQLRRWHKNMDKMKRVVTDTKRKKTKTATMPGRPSRLDKLKDKVLPWLDSWRAEGKAVSVRMVVIRCKHWDKTLRRLKRYTLMACVRRFLKSNDIVMRTTTHTSQEDPRLKVDTATAFLSTTIPLLCQRNRSKKFIINMDQTPYNPSDSPSKTLSQVGSKTVAAKTMKTGLGRITVCLAVAADGTKLTPLIVFRGKPGGRIEREFKDFPATAKYIVQENAWTDERVMLYWVENVLRPYVEDCPAGIVPYLLLDKYKCHYQGSISKKVEDCGVEWDIIPGGCTGLIQPIDVGIGKPFKNRMRYRWEEWMMEQVDTEERVQKRVTPKIARNLVAGWAGEALERLPNDVVYNSWRHTPFSYFPEEQTRETDFDDDDEYYTSSDDDDDGNDEVLDNNGVGN